jgi:hypothetical protein
LFPCGRNLLVQIVCITGIATAFDAFLYYVSWFIWFNGMYVKNIEVVLLLNRANSNFLPKPPIIKNDERSQKIKPISQ